MGRRDEEEEDLDEEEEEDENAELVAGLAESPPPPDPAPAAARAAAPAQAPQATVPQAPARTRRPKSPRAGVGVPSLEKPQRGFANAIEMVDAVAAFLHAHPEVGNVNDLVVRIFAIDGAERNLGTVQFIELLSPPESPGERLQNLVIERWHLPMNRGRAIYEIKVNWRDGSYYAGSQLRLGSTEEILAIRRAEMAAQREPAPGYGGGYGYPPPYAQARPQYPPSYPQYREPAYAQAPPPPGYGAPQNYPPPAQPGASADPEVIRLRSELDRTSGMLQEALAAAREGRQFQPPPQGYPYPGQPGYGAPPSAPAGPRSVEQIVEETVGKHVNALGNMLMQKLGLAPAGAQGVAGAPPPAPTNGIAQELQHGVEAMVMGIVKEGLGNVGSMLRSSMKSTFTGMGAPPPEPEVIPAPDPPSNPADDLPFQNIPLGTTWGDGRPMIYSQDKETGDIDLKASILSNPIVAESAFKLGQVLAEAAKAFAERRPPAADGSTVVNRTPRGAVDAGVGVASAPAPQQGPAPQPTPKPAAPPVNGAAAPAPPAAAGFPSR